MFSKEKIRHRASQVGETFRSLDLFKEPIPGFNIEGRAGVGTYLGSLVTISLIIVMFLYGTMKFDRLVNRVNPSITIMEEPQEFDE